MLLFTAVSLTRLLAPQNCTFGYHAGGWGKPPVDEMGKPLYGDVFGTNASDFQVGTTHTHTHIYNCVILAETVNLVCMKDLKRTPVTCPTFWRRLNRALNM